MMPWYAFGQPGEMPTAFHQGPEWFLEQQLGPGEVMALVANLDDNGMPIPAALPKAAS